MSAVLCLAVAMAAQAETVAVGRFSAGDLSGWETKPFKGETRYRTTTIDGRGALRAQSDASASGLVKRITVDLTKTPILRWSWRVGNILPGLDERTKPGDDYPVRVYLILSGGALFWRTRALNYVWSNHEPVGSSWPNAFTSNATMLAVESGPDKVGRWVSYRRDVREDLHRYLGRDVERIDAVAIMTDTDNSGRHAVAYYGDISFSDH